jgi:hypothetical protein
MKPLVKNAADEEQVREAKGKAKLGRDRELDDVREILSSPAGRRFYWRYLEECKLYKQCADHSGSWTYFNEGQRNIGLKLLSDLNEACPEAYLVMLKEKEI